MSLRVFFQTMVVHERDGLLSHPLCQNILSQKWYEDNCCLVRSLHVLHWPFQNKISADYEGLNVCVF